MSKGAEELLQIVKGIFPHQRIEFEHNVADRGALFIDIFLPELDVGFEYDGVQHFEYNEHFHGSRDSFLKAKRRDAEKNDLCEQKGITLIRVAYNEDLTEELVLGKLEEQWNG